MKINLNRLVAYSFLSLLMTNIVMAQDAPVPECPSLKKSQLTGEVRNTGFWTAFFTLDETFTQGEVITTGHKRQDAIDIAKIAFDKTIHRGQATKKVNEKDGTYYFRCDGLHNYSRTLGVKEIKLYTKDYAPVQPFTYGQNTPAPVQHSIQEKNKR